MATSSIWKRVIHCPHCPGIVLQHQPQANVAVCSDCGCNFTIGKTAIIIGGTSEHCQQGQIDYDPDHPKRWNR